MRTPKLFGEALTELIHAKRVSLYELGEQVGGKTLLKRAMQDELSEAKREALFARLKDLRVFTDDELRVLERGLQVSRIGVREYLTKNALVKLMSDDSLTSDESIADERITDEAFLQRLQALESADSVSIVCINCCYASLFSALQKCFENRDANIVMRHYINFDRAGCDVASFVYCSTQLMSDPRYRPYSIPKEAELQCIDGDFCVISSQKGGRQCECVMIMKSADEVYLMPCVSQLKLTAFFDAIVGGIDPPPAAIKELNAPGMRYIDISMKYFALELNRSTYIVSSDFAYMQIPPDIVAAAFDVNSLIEIGVGNAELEQLGSILTRRYKNFYTKKKDNYQIVSMAGIKHFLETGGIQGSFNGLRTFTPSERIAILEDILDKSRLNPNYHLYMFKNHDYRVKYTTIAFDKLGISIFPRRSDGSERADFNHMFLTIPDFTRQFIEHYLNHMLKYYCHSEAETDGILRELLISCKQTSL